MQMYDINSKEGPAVHRQTSIQVTSKKGQQYTIYTENSPAKSCPGIQENIRCWYLFVVMQSCRLLLIEIKAATLYLFTQHIQIHQSQAYQGHKVHLMNTYALFHLKH